MQTLLVIAYYFPPFGLSGVQRTLKFVKNLPSFGWDVCVLTVDPGAYFAKDYSLLAELEGLPVTIERVPSRDPLSFLRKRDIVKMPSSRVYSLLGKVGQSLFVPDNKIGWRKAAVRRALEIIDSRSIDAVFATAPPFTDLLIARDIKEKRGLPVVLDYRDAWLHNPLHFYATPLHRLAHRKLESGALRYADQVITINRRIKELIVQDYSGLTHNDVMIIPQGFDVDDFTGPARVRTSKMIISYAGTLYRNRTLTHFLKALNMMFDHTPEARKQVEVHLYGVPRDCDFKLIAAMNMKDNVIHHGYVEHRQCTRALQDSDVLWLLIGDEPGADMMSTGKLFDYLGARRPILACVPDGEARNALTPSGAAFFAPPADAEAIYRQLSTLYGLWKRNALPAPNPEYVSQFDRRKLTEQLAKTLNLLIASKDETARVHVREI